MMTRYSKAINIWDLSELERRALSIGQWVYAGDPTTKGRFGGEGRTTVIAWLGRGKGRWKSYSKALYHYGKPVRRIA